LAAMPHMSVREGRFAGVPARLFRVSFTGELGFEINVAAGFGRAAWDLLRETGATRYGTETMHVLRAEKGFVVVGQETDGTVTPDDLGMSRTIARGKPDFVGKRSLARSDMLREDRKQLVGLLTADPEVVLEEGAQLTNGGTISLGHVTSAYYSAALGRSIGLALLSGGRSRIGTKLRVPLTNGVADVAVTDPVFYDRGGDRTAQSIAPERARHASRTIAARPFTPPRAAVCAEAGLSMAPFERKFNVRTRERLVPALRAATHDGYTALSLGPDEYLVIGEEPPPLMADSIVDVSHRTIGLRVKGPRAAWCLNAFCALDLDDFPPAGCTRTLFGKAEIMLWRLGETEFHVETARSFGAYVWGLLEEARREFLSPPASC
jgi:sarcosine oxidase subunit alpha